MIPVLVPRDAVGKQGRRPPALSLLPSWTQQRGSARHRSSFWVTAPGHSCGMGCRREDFGIVQDLLWGTRVGKGVARWGGTSVGAGLWV